MPLCKECGKQTEGWGGKPGLYTDHDYNQFPLCKDCGGECCGDCATKGPCEFGISGGGPSAIDPEEIYGTDIR